MKRKMGDQKRAEADNGDDDDDNKEQKEEVRKEKKNYKLCIKIQKFYNL